MPVHPAHDHWYPRRPKRGSDRDWWAERAGRDVVGGDERARKCPHAARAAPTNARTTSDASTGGGARPPIALAACSATWRRVKLAGQARTSGNSRPSRTASHQRCRLTQPVLAVVPMTLSTLVLRLTSAGLKCSKPNKASACAMAGPSTCVPAASRLAPPTPRFCRLHKVAPARHLQGHGIPQWLHRPNHLAPASSVATQTQMPTRRTARASTARAPRRTHPFDGGHFGDPILDAEAASYDSCGAPVFLFFGDLPGGMRKKPDGMPIKLVAWGRSNGVM